MYGSYAYLIYEHRKQLADNTVLRLLICSLKQIKENKQLNNITGIPRDINQSSFIYDNEEVRPIPNADGYYVSESGKIYSTHKNWFYQIKPYLDGKGNYLLCRININNKPKTMLVHRLVAIAFIPNPNNLPEVNHKDKNKQNCHYTNLEWCTRKENLNDSYSTMGPTRNYRIAKLYRENELLGEFKGITKAARYAEKKFGASFSSLDKYLRSGEFRIEYEGEQTRKVHKQTTETRKHGEVRLYRIEKDGKERYIVSFKSYTELAEYFAEVLDIKVSESRLSYDVLHNKETHGYIIKRKQ